MPGVPLLSQSAAARLPCRGDGGGWGGRHVGDAVGGKVVLGGANGANSATTILHRGRGGVEGSPGSRAATALAAVAACAEHPRCLQIDGMARGAPPLRTGGRGSRGDRVHGVLFCLGLVEGTLPYPTRRNVL